MGVRMEQEHPLYYVDSTYPSKSMLYPPPPCTTPLEADLNALHQPLPSASSWVWPVGGAGEVGR